MAAKPSIRPSTPSRLCHLPHLLRRWHGRTTARLEFFRGAPPGSYSAFVHCKFADQCQANLRASGLNAIFTVVPTVFSAWCSDLVSPMLQLLRSALDAAPQDVLAKFVFLSSTHLPLKPFGIIQAELGKHPGASDFCLYPPTHWHVAKSDSAMLRTCVLPGCLLRGALGAMWIKGCAMGL